MAEPIIDRTTLDRIVAGEAILFLGAGAVRGATGANKTRALTGNELRDALSDKFLKGDLRDRPLPRVADFAKNEHGLSAVQGFIAQLFEPLEPCDFHLLIPTFRWHSIVTTNYDRIVEKAYAKVPARLQNLVPLIRDDENLNERLRDPTGVPFLKLHGCVTVTNDATLPFILSTEEYVKYRKSRGQLFDLFRTWAQEHPVVFCGYDLADPNIEHILYNLGDTGINRPPYITVKPRFADFEKRFYQARRIYPVDATAADFFPQLDAAVPRDRRSLIPAKLESESPLRGWLKSEPSSSLSNYVENELEHIYKGMPTKGANAADFYSGADRNWGVIAAEMDVRRRIADDILQDAFLETSAARGPRFLLVTGYAGSGKSIILRRIGWDAAHDWTSYVFFLRPGGFVRPELLLELHRISKVPPTIIIEDALYHKEDLCKLFQMAKGAEVPLCVLAGARSHEFNVSGDELSPFVTQEYEVSRLSEKEILQLLQKLEHHRALGYLEKIPVEARHIYLNEKLNRELLVALHEATSGKPFEEIVLNEYEKVTPVEARLLYLDVATLNRLNVGVRAGLIARVSNITFAEFKAKFLLPLEHIVIATGSEDLGARDYLYRTRHPLIADMVFNQVLSDQSRRADQLIRIIGGLNLAYETDDMAFKQLTRGREIAKIFSSYELGRQVLASAAGLHASPSYLNHQFALYELSHDGGTLRKAWEAILAAEASTNGRSEITILTTKANILRSMALEGTSPLERRRYREEAKKILGQVVGKSRETHQHVVLANLLLDEVKEKLEDLDRAAEKPTDLQIRALNDAIREAEESVSRGLQRHPNSEYLLTAEAKLAETLDNWGKAGDALKRAHHATPTSGFIAVRYSRYLRNHNEQKEGLEVLRTCLARNPLAREAHLEVARVLIRQDEESNSQEILFHLRKSFTDGDSNFSAQYYFARQNLLLGDKKLGAAMFARLKQLRGPHEGQTVKDLVRDKEGNPVWFEGFPKRVYPSFLFVWVEKLGIDVYINKDEFPEDRWPFVSITKSVKFNIGFNLKGPAGINATFD